MKWWFIPVWFLLVAITGYFWGMFKTLAGNDWRKYEMKCKLFHKWGKWSDVVHKYITHRGWHIGDKDIQERWCERCNKYSYRVVRNR